MLKLIVGNVNSNKSLLLKEYYHNIVNQYKVKPIVYYPAECTNEMYQLLGATKIFNISDLYNKLRDNKIVFIDEVQFITHRQYITDFMKFIEYCDTNSIDVYMFGLFLDYLGEPFEIITRVIPYVDEIITKNRICDICKNQNANMSLRYIYGVPDTDQISDTFLLESDDITYKSVCRDCFRKITGLKAIK